MQELDDIALLREYVERDSEDAFATLVARHIDRVYSVALRHAKNPHQAEEITQAVFVILAKKSQHLRKGVILEGWLYQTARLTAVTQIRSEIRRAHREQEAHIQTVLNENESDVWSRITPLLDAALAGLSETDRNAVVMRFFYGKSMREIGTALGGNEDMARMRVNRAIERLRKYFFRHGVTSTTATIAEAISVNSVHAAPIALAKTVTVVAIAKGAAAHGSTSTLTKGALKLMAASKIKTAIITGAIVLLAAGTTVVFIKRHPEPKHETIGSSQGPIAQPALAAWQQGDKSMAIGRFLEADWSGHPLFAANSALSLSEVQFKALTKTDQQAMSSEMTSQLNLLKQVTAAVTQAGRDAATKGDTDQARKCFTSLAQCGTALDSSNYSSLVQLVGQGLKKTSEAELAKIGQ